MEMMKEYLEQYIAIWKSIFRLKESLSRKCFWFFLLINYLCYSGITSICYP